MPLLFSYGTLHQAHVQLSTFGGYFKDNERSSFGFEQSVVKIESTANSIVA
jgi:hypothetical protein